MPKKKLFNVDAELHLFAVLFLFFSFYISLFLRFYANTILFVLLSHPLTPFYLQITRRPKNDGETGRAQGGGIERASRNITYEIKTAPPPFLGFCTIFGPFLTEKARRLSPDFRDVYGGRVFLREMEA